MYHQICCWFHPVYFFISLIAFFNCNQFSFIYYISLLNFSLSYSIILWSLVTLFMSNVLGRLATSPDPEDVLYVEDIFCCPGAQSPLLTRARCSRSIPYVGHMWPFVVHGRWLLQACYCVGLTPSVAGCKAEPRLLQWLCFVRLFSHVGSPLRGTGTAQGQLSGLLGGEILRPGSGEDSGGLRGLFGETLGGAALHMNLIWGGKC